MNSLWAQHAAIRPEFTNPLSARQCTILRGLVGGMSNGAIADALCLTEYTIKYHCRSIYQLFEVSNRAELMSRLLNDHGLELLQFIRKMPPPAAPRPMHWVAEKKPMTYRQTSERRSFQSHHDYLKKRL
jgi:DNA-binding CsgD family transcriptional regulator